MNVKVDMKLDIKPSVKILGGDKLGINSSHNWHRIIAPYTPHREGTLERNVTYKPWEVVYNEPYAHYMYNGYVYVDPVNKTGGHSPNGGVDFFSRKGVKKIKSGRRFNYSKELNPKATFEWDKAAVRDGKNKELAKTIQEWVNTNL